MSTSSPRATLTPLSMNVSEPAKPRPLNGDGRKSKRSAKVSSTPVTSAVSALIVVLTSKRVVGRPEIGVVLVDLRGRRDDLVGDVLVEERHRDQRPFVEVPLQRRVGVPRVACLQIGIADAQPADRAERRVVLDAKLCARGDGIELGPAKCRGDGRTQHEVVPEVERRDEGRQPAGVGT